MQTTEILGLKKPDKNEFYNVDVENYNADVVDALFEKDADGNVVAKNANKLDGHDADDFARSDHKHTKSEITDFPTSLPASDVSAWAKASTKPTYTATEVGLGNVPNVSTNDQTPTFTEASANANLTSGEKLSVAFGKIAKAIKSLISHIADTTSHVTSSERSTWNNKANASHGNHVPTTQTASNSVFLRNDNTWQTVTPANIGASATGHKHTKSEITDFPTSMTPTSHNQSASTITAGTFAGKMNANANAMVTLTNAQLRDVVIKDSVTEGGTATESNGTIVFSKS